MHREIAVEYGSYTAFHSVELIRLASDVSGGRQVSGTAVRVISLGTVETGGRRWKVQKTVAMRKTRNSDLGAILHIVWTSSFT